MKCRVCGRPLTSEDSLASGMGPVCREHREVIAQPELFSGLPTVAMLANMNDVIDFDRLTGRIKEES